MNQSTHQLFVYGSLLSGFRHPAYEYISRFFTLVAEAKIKGNLYDMGAYPAAIPSDKEDAYILGELYQITQPDEFTWAMAQLDDYEGLNTEEGESPLYRREMTTVYLPNSSMQAWVYWFNGDTSNRPLIENGSVLDYMANKKKS